MKPANAAPARALLAALEGKGRREPPPFTMPGERAPVIREKGDDFTNGDRVLVLDYTAQHGIAGKVGGIEVGPDATLPRWFVPLDLCDHGLKHGLCGACTERKT